MSRQVTPKELARILAGLLVTPERVGELTEMRPFAEFFTAAAELVTNYCGGAIYNDATCEGDEDGNPMWLVGVHTNPDLPHPIRNIWSSADPEGVEAINGEHYLDEALQARDAAERDLIPATLALLPASRQALIESTWVLSTAHLSPPEISALTRIAQDGAEHHGNAPLVSAACPQGWILNVGASTASEHEPLDPVRWPRLVPILTQAAAWGVHFVRFDADGPFAPQWPIHEQ